MSNGGSVVVEKPDFNVYGNRSIPVSIVTSLQNHLVYYLFSDTEVAVYSYLYTFNEEPNILLPYDALGSEYMTLSFNVDTNNLTCEIVGQDGNLDVYIYTTTGNKTLQDNVQQFRVTLKNGDQTGTVFKSRFGKQFAVFCGSGRTAHYGGSLNQLPPTSSWGTYHISPVIGTYDGSTMLAKLKIVTNSDNTTVDIKGDFSETQTIQFRGEALEIDINAVITYTITSSNPVLVGMLLVTLANPTSSSFKILPAVANFAESSVLHSFSLLDNPINNVESLTVTNDIGDYNTILLPGVASENVMYFYEALDTAYSLQLTYSLSQIKLVPSTTLHKDLARVSFVFQNHLSFYSHTSIIHFL